MGGASPRSWPAIARWIENTPQGVSWLGFFYGGNIVGATVTFLVLWTRHPLARELRDATGAEDD